ncbi:MAG: alpha-1,2-fucosyltransferase [Chitinophagaceae bacterium]|nr:MAG: alpha-1,2-fucosyltransferase [Chitinophagaceae bacterium]
MVISHIFGGLGNQLFQYAAGRRLSLKYSVPLVLDTTAFESYKLRKFDLEYFYASVKIAGVDDINRLKPSSRFQKLLQYSRPKKSRTYHRERSFSYDPSFESIGPEVYLKGYFQCEPYFSPIADTIRKEFRIREEYIEHVLPHREQFSSQNSVGIHIRRGDYKNSDVMQLLSSIDAEYYKRAINLAKEKITDPSFYFFSDDIEWVKENLYVPDAVYVSGNITASPLEDFYLLSQCAHQVIPNSTFAWWAAWLNPNPAKFVIAPQQWFNNSNSNRDRVPSDWHLL